MFIRSVKRNRQLRRLATVSLVSAVIFLFFLQSTARPAISRRPSHDSAYQQQQSHMERYQHDKYDTSISQQRSDDVQKQIDVTLPREFVLESIRRIRHTDKKEKLQEVMESTKSSSSSLPVRHNTTEFPEDSVYRKDSDNEYLPLGDGRDPNEKFISFYPHSGFHNQRIALVNALMLAERLNRTLLMPPVVLGEPIHWRKYDSLESFHRRGTKAHLAEECRPFLEDHVEEQVVPEKCKQSFRYTSLRWDRLFDLRRIKQRINIRYRDDYDRTYLQRKYGITNDDTFHIKDELLYDYRISDSENQPLQKYQREIFIWDLARRKERLLSFGSLFGTGRVMYTNQESKDLRDFLFQQFVFSRQALPELFEEADRIMHRLGGPRSYISIHARVGDSIFERFSPQVMGKLWSDLQKYLPLVVDHEHEQQQLYATGQDHLQCLNEDRDKEAIDWNTMTTPRHPLVLFMATDAPDPREHPLIQPIFDAFPCVVTLRDLFDFKQSRLATLVNPEDGIRYGKYLVPFLDGLIASRAQEFTGSMWSTFSAYIRFLHQEYNNQHL
ncbi:hypothetical protein LRAMOSA11190 [Lichtheimia ramosa]|uniref:CigA protein n=1 Tax=Lichtheimia ramosa TaxID=688394 RepID=A0A077WTS5_9FUNG|nr:hypothetical protein LRAMOSA11190 [Lichtheimia ramosa]